MGAALAQHVLDQVVHRSPQAKSLLASIEVWSGPESGKVLDPRKAVILVPEMSSADIGRFLSKTEACHFISSSREDASLDLLTTALLVKQPETVLHPESTIFLRKLPWAGATPTPILQAEFNSIQSKAKVIDSLRQITETNRKVRPYRHRLLQIADELITNALFCAPVDFRGEPLYRDIPRNLSVEYPSHQPRAKLNVFLSSKRILIGCEDPYGSLDLAETRRKLATSFTRNLSQVGHPIGVPLGLGLRTVMENSNSLYILCKRRELTSVYCAFDVGISNKAVESTPKHFHLTVA